MSEAEERFREGIMGRNEPREEAPTQKRRLRLQRRFGVSTEQREERKIRKHQREEERAERDKTEEATLKVKRERQERKRRIRTLRKETGRSFFGGKRKKKDPLTPRERAELNRLLRKLNR